MARKQNTKDSRSCCPLTSSETKRKAADKTAASIKDAFPPGIASPALRALAAAGYTRLDQLTRTTEAELLKLHGMGPKALATLKAALRAKGKSFAKTK